MILTREYLHLVLDEFLDKRAVAGQMDSESLWELCDAFGQWQKYLRSLEQLEKDYPKVFRSEAAVRLVQKGKGQP